jgi:Big-like domain-containing protein
VPVNDPPTAVAETVNAIRNVPVTVNLMANDIDPDGAADLVGIRVVSSDSRLGVVTVSGGSVTFTPTGTGTNLPLTYEVRDHEATSTVTSTVTVVASETISPVRWQYTVNQNRWVVSGTVSPNMGQTMTIAYASGAFLVNGSCTGNAAGITIGTAVTDNTGTWTLDRGGIDPNSNLNPTNQGRRSNFWCGNAPTLRISSSASGANVTTGAVQVK